MVEIAKAIGEQVEAAHELASQAADVAEFSAPLVIASAAGWGGGTLAAGGGGMTGGVAALGGVAAFAVIAVGVGVFGTYKIADYMIVSDEEREPHFNAIASGP